MDFSLTESRVSEWPIPGRHGEHFAKSCVVARGVRLREGGEYHGTRSLVEAVSRSDVIRRGDVTTFAGVVESCAANELAAKPNNGWIAVLESSDAGRNTAKAVRSTAGFFQ